MPQRKALSAKALVLFSLVLASCATLPERPQGSFPLEWPRIPAPSASAAQVHDVPAKDIVLTGETVLAPNVNNVAAKQGQLVALGPILGQFLASLAAPEHPGSLLARTGAYQPFGMSGARAIPGQVKASGTILRMSPNGE